MRFAIRLVAALVAFAVGSVLVWYFIWPWRPTGGLAAADPRLSYQGPFKNVHPEVAYVPEETCAECHDKEATTFRHHPMARTLIPIGDVKLPPLDEKRHNPFEALGQRFEVVVKDRGVWHMRSATDSAGKRLFEQSMPVHFAIGSGTHAHSFLSIDGGTVLQTPITWFAQKGVWDLSPGFAPNQLAGRRVGADCLFCHSNSANEDPRDETAYRQPIFPRGHGIGCQRCHGPGGEHVKAPGNTVKMKLDGRDVELDPTIVNPKHLSPHLRESICWQCHLEGDVRVLRRGRARFDFRPGMPLEDFVGVFVDAAETQFDDVVNHVEQMLQSRCYKASSEPKLGCVSCHDPHEKLTGEQAVAHYRAACLRCHGENECSLPKAERLAQHKDDDCTACHMRPFMTSNIVHVSSTDHRIPRRPAARKLDRPVGLRMGPVQELVSVFESQRGKSDPELDRDRALAGALLARRGRPLVHPLIMELEAAAQRDPGDLMVKAQLALALINQQEPAKALPLVDEVLARQADHEWALLGQAIACAQTGKIDDSLASWRRLVKQAPSQPGFRAGLIDTLMRGSQWKEAEQVARTWLAYDPGSAEAHALLRDVLLQLDRRGEAEEENRIVKELTPR